MRGERMPERVRSGTLRDTGAPDGVLDDALENRLVEVMAAELARLSVAIEPRRRETHCHTQSRPAFGYFRANAVGSSTQSASDCKSRRCCSRVASRCCIRSRLIIDGSTVTRSLSPFAPSTTI